MAERRRLTRNQNSLVPKEQPKPEADFSVIYRPQTFDDVLGHEEVCSSVKAALDTGVKRCFVFTGPSGIGKTTLSRAISNYLSGGDPKQIDYIERDGAVYSGADKARELVDWMRYRPLIGAGKKVVCVDEAHALSTQAWQCLLKSVEEPPSYGYWIFCTTAEGKIPDTIMTRCLPYNLQPLKAKVLVGLLEVVNHEQKLGLDDDILDLIAHEAGGSPRQALSSLAKCRNAKDRQEAAILLQSAMETPELIELCRGLSKGQLSWPKAMGVLKGLSHLDPEGIRIQIVLYFSAIVSGAKTPDQAGPAVEMMDYFLPGPYYKANKHAELYRDMARVLLRGG